MAYPPMPAVNDPDAWMKMLQVAPLEGAMVSFNTIESVAKVSFCPFQTAPLEEAPLQNVSNHGPADPSSVL
eukprot:166873-Hanusia_phi.AAC.1